jgi:hypothetical protein
MANAPVKRRSVVAIDEKFGTLAAVDAPVGRSQAAPAGCAAPIWSLGDAGREVHGESGVERPELVGTLREGWPIAVELVPLALVFDGTGR